jgi:hypothetical protein
MLSMNPPFTKAVTEDPYYRQIASNKWKVFWEAHERTKPEGIFSNDFKSLMTCILA